MHSAYTRNRLPIVLLSFLLLCIPVKSQERQAVKRHAFKSGVGSVALKDAELIPSGISATHLFLQFDSSKERQERLFEFESRVSYLRPSDADLQSEKSLYSYGMQLNTGCVWSRKIPFQLLSATCYLGAGESLNGFFFIPNETLPSPYYIWPFGGWALSTDAACALTKRYSSFVVAGKVKMPVFSFGRFSDYQDHPLLKSDKAVFKEYLIPNAVATINRYFDFRLDLSVTHTISATRKIDATVGGKIHFIRSNVFDHLYLQQSNLLYIGIIF